MTKWKPTNIPDRYDKKRLAQLEPLRQAIQTLSLPPDRIRKLYTILAALEVQIEDGGDNPQVNDLLLAALKAGVLHQVDEQQARPVMRALEQFSKAEAERRQKAEARMVPPVQTDLAAQLEEHVNWGYGLLSRQRYTSACDQWLAAWDLAKQLLTPSTQTTADFDATFSQFQIPLQDWSMDLVFELHNAGLQDPAYRGKRLGFVREFLARFPHEEPDRYLEFRRAEGEALWSLGHKSEAEGVFQAIVAELPHKAWGYIGWSDEYYLFQDSSKDYDRAEAVLRQALAQPGLDDRGSVLARLEELYRQWGKAEQATAVASELAALRGTSTPQPARSKPSPSDTKKRKRRKPKRKKRRGRR